MVGTMERSGSAVSPTASAKQFAVWTRFKLEVVNRTYQEFDTYERQMDWCSFIDLLPNRDLFDKIAMKELTRKRREQCGSARLEEGNAEPAKPKSEDLRSDGGPSVAEDAEVLTDVEDNMADDSGDDDYDPDATNPFVAAQNKFASEVKLHNFFNQSEENSKLAIGLYGRWCVVCDCCAKNNTKTQQKLKTYFSDHVHTIAHQKALGSRAYARRKGLIVEDVFPTARILYGVGSLKEFDLNDVAKLEHVEGDCEVIISGRSAHLLVTNAIQHRGACKHSSTNPGSSRKRMKKRGHEKVFLDVQQKIELFNSPKMQRSGSNGCTSANLLSPATKRSSTKSPSSLSDGLEFSGSNSSGGTTSSGISRVSFIRRWRPHTTYEATHSGGCRRDAFAR